nr:hypothetical protein Q903MT_gene1310 [Picea sitchensis]
MDLVPTSFSASVLCFLSFLGPDRYSFPLFHDGNGAGMVGYPYLPTRGMERYPSFNLGEWSAYLFFP